MAQNGSPEEKTSKIQHGFPEEKIYEYYEKFEEETKAEREKCKTLGIFNEEILKAKKEAPLYKICKGIFVGNILLKNAKEEKHEYLLAQSDEFIIIIPFGPIQSVVHILAIPKVPLYNAVSLGMESVLLVKKMQAALVKVVTDVLTPDSIPQRIYLRALSLGIDRDANDFKCIRITQEGNKLDTVDMSGAKASDILGRMLKDYYAELKKSGTPLKQVVSTDLHLHPTNSVGQLHMHGWIAQRSLITDNGKKLQPKNTPLDRIIPVLGKFRGIELKERKFKVIVKNKGLD